RPPRLLTRLQTPSHPPHTPLLHPIPTPPNQPPLNRPGHLPPNPPRTLHMRHRPRVNPPARNPPFSPVQNLLRNPQRRNNMTPLRTKTLCTEKSRFGCSDCVEGVLEVWGEGFYLGYLGLEGE